ncbi:Palmitoyltransferase ZDHHC7 [Phytophthora cinnamomi]|uniref:Palmitoyltransferase ZDHHC7 n=1 Tax=Phytophthora cinnamomi TaxID=4785 RepID=UPI0035594E3C|nr:Palmitoyltransferase ZDHHC7 [Phytophthora cinnamomi]
MSPLLSRRGRKRPRWFVWDPAGIVIAAFAWVLLFALLGAVLTSISQWVGLLSPMGATEGVWFSGLSPMGATEGVWFSGLFAMCLWCHVVVATTNPGTVPFKLKGLPPAGTSDEDEEDGDVEEVEEEMPLNEYEEAEDDGSLLVYCDECEIYRPTRAMHCHTCERPWVNNCVGIGNQKAFLLMLLYVTATSVQAALLVLMQYALCSRGKYSCGLQNDQFPGKLGGWILAAAAVFGLFCSLMLAMELYNIYQDPLFTTIANQLAARRGGDKSQSTLERHLSVVCGTDGMRASWFFPPPERRALHDMEIVQGFRCRPEDADIC